MNNKIRKCCPNCSQFYQIKSPSQQKTNIPLFLSCGHSMCETCIRNIVKFEEPIECKICHCDMKVCSTDVALLALNKSTLYELFPVNFMILGELTFQQIEQHYEAPKEDDNCFIDLHAILKNKNTQGQCMECRSPTSKMCKQCVTILCESCFNKSHKNFIIFKNHSLQNIEPIVEPNNCKIHKGKSLEYYCNDCSKPICMDCLVVGGDKSCKNHNVVSMQEVNEAFIEKLNDISPQVNETFKRLTKTAVDIGHLLHNIENESGPVSELTKMLANVEQHFSKLSYAVQKHKREVINVIVKLKCSEKESLHKAKDKIANSIKKAKETLDAINSCLDPKTSKQINLAILLDEAKRIAEAPWYLTRDKSNDPLKVAVNEDLCTLINDYIHMEGNADAVYKLYSTSELSEGVEIPPPPTAPVFPPEMAKDVRVQNQTKVEKNYSKAPEPMFYKDVPKYRSKSGSISSLASGDSGNSLKSSSTVYGDGFHKPLVQSVEPFAESQHPKQLNEGSQELIYITHIVDPHNFFVQRACHQSMVKEMLREFRNAVSLPKPSMNHVTEGKLYLVFNKADNMWQRCRVVSIDRKAPNKPTFCVFCIDFGSTEVVSIDKLRLLPPARVQLPYPLAIHCRLANVKPKSGSWSSDDAYLIQNIIDNRQAIIHVRHIRSTSNYTVTLECDVTTFDDGISIAHALVFHERAVMCDPKLPYPKTGSAKDIPKLYTSSNDFKPKSVEEVYITHIISPDKFYVRKRHLKNVYDKLCEDLEQEYSLSVKAGSIYLPEIGMVCAVNVEKQRTEAESAAWARGVVTELPGRGRVRVLLPDTGAHLLVHWTALRYIHFKFTTLRALATECHLAGVTPLNKTWSPGSVALLQKFEETLLELHVEDNKRGSVGVTLYDKADEDNIVCINTEMIKYKFAVTFGLFMFNKNSSVEEQVITNKSPLDPKPRPKPKAGGVQILKKGQAPMKIKESQLEAKDKGPLRLEVKILCYQSPSLIYVSVVHQQKLFSDLYEKIQKHYSTKTYPSKADWAVGNLCCTVCSQSKTWRRAVIVELQGDNAKIFYSDFACVETVPISSLRELTSEFSSIGDAAIKCHLFGVVSADGEEWPTITKEYLKELLDAYPRVFITRVGNYQGNSMPVQLWAYHTIQGGALEPNKSEWRCLNKKIIEQGLAVPDKNQQEPNANDQQSIDDDMLSFLKNVRGSITDWLQLEPLPTKPLITKPDTETPKSSSPAESEDMDVKQDPFTSSTSNTMFISDWLPPEPLPSKEFNARPTYIDNEGIIYLHDINQQDTLDLIRKALQVRFKKDDPKAKYAKWSVGEPCIALFFLDNLYYRGRVLEVNEDTSSCLIHYVDYGNEEICSFKNLRKSIALHQIPIQAHKCILSRIRPIGGKWDSQTLDYIHKSVVEKQCFVKIVGEPIEGVLPIDLKFDKLWINDHLVDFELAEYTDGSKAVVRKFVPSQALTSNVIESDAIESDSGPDYIIESNDTLTSQESFDLKSFEGKDWNKLIEAEEEFSIEGKFITFPKNDLDEFMCNVTLVCQLKILQLSVIHNDETNLLYEEMFEILQREGENMSPLNGVFENKACIALFHEDNRWYRASILQYSESDGRIKVRYVDYGNTEIVSLADVREINEEWTKLPPATVAACLHGVMVNPKRDIKDVTKEFANTFLDKGPFLAKVITYDDCLPCVELRNDDGDLIYETLLQNGVLIKCD